MVPFYLVESLEKNGFCHSPKEEDRLEETVACHDKVMKMSFDEVRPAT